MLDSQFPSSAVADIEVAAHTLLLPQGTYCIHVTEVTPGLTGDRLPGLSISTAPGEEGHAIDLGRLPGEPWLRQPGDALLVRVRAARVRLLLTSYNLARATGATPPKINIQRLDAEAAPVLVPSAPPATPDVLVHARKRGDVTGGYGEWLGDTDPEATLEGFALTPPPGVSVEELEYQALLGKGWFSPWVAGGEFCGSRGLQLPILGYRIRLRGDAADRLRCRYSATFVDGSTIGPVSAGELCALPDPQAVVKLQVVFADMADATGAPIGRSKPATMPRAKGSLKPAARTTAKSPA